MVPELFLQARVAVVPVGAGLRDRIAIDERFARRNAGERDAWHAVHLERQQNAVPVDRRRLVQLVAHAEGDRLTRAKAQQGGRHAAVDGHSHALPSVDLDRGSPNYEVELPSPGGQLVALQAVWDARPGWKQTLHSCQRTSRSRRSQYLSPSHHLHISRHARFAPPWTPTGRIRELVSTAANRHD